MSEIQISIIFFYNFLINDKTELEHKGNGLIFIGSDNVP